MSSPCPTCDAHALATKVENFPYEPTPGFVVLLRGVEIARCKECGTHVPRIPAIAKLHRAIAAAIVRKRGRLAPPEVRFLRKHLGWAGVDFAAHMGVTPETVSRWESPKKASEQIGPQADRLLRVMVQTREPVSDYSLAELKSIDRGKATPLRLGMRIVPSKNTWEPIAA